MENVFLKDSAKIERKTESVTQLTRQLIPNHIFRWIKLLRLQEVCSGRPAGIRVENRDIFRLDTQGNEHHSTCMHQQGLLRVWPPGLLLPTLGLWSIFFWHTEPALLNLMHLILKENPDLSLSSAARPFSTWQGSSRGQGSHGAARSYLQML